MMFRTADFLLLSVVMVMMMLGVLVCRRDSGFGIGFQRIRLLELHVAVMRARVVVGVLGVLVVVEVGLAVRFRDGRFFVLLVQLGSTLGLGRARMTCFVPTSKCNL